MPGTKGKALRFSGSFIIFLDRRCPDRCQPRTLQYKSSRWSRNDNWGIIFNFAQLRLEITYKAWTKSKILLLSKVYTYSDNWLKVFEKAKLRIKSTHQCFRGPSSSCCANLVELDPQSASGTVQSSKYGDDGNICNLKADHIIKTCAKTL